VLLLANGDGIIFTMHDALNEAEAWKRMVLRSMPEPAWLSPDAPQVDVVLSTRARVMRNLRGHKFTHAATPHQLVIISREILEAAESLGLSAFRQISNAEREYLVACRLASPHFEWAEPGRALLLDSERSLSLMVHEEDHLRLQALTAGWSPGSADRLSKACLRALGEKLEFAFSPAFGYLSASPYNAGRGRRLSAMFHLIGLAQAKRLPSVLNALGERGIAARGLFGEASKAVGAYVQVSVIGGSRHDFTGACEYLLTEERECRQEVGRDALEEKAIRVHEFAMQAQTLSLSDALRVLAWVRWASLYGISGFPKGARVADRILTLLEPRIARDPEKLGAERANLLRGVLTPL
jgi:protein arginine kinase